MNGSSQLALSAVTLMGAVGCTIAEPEGELASGALTGSVGVLHVERADFDAEALEGAESAVTLRAAFARYAGVSGDTVLGVLGSGSGAELGTCTLLDPDDALVEEDADVELLDVGALRVSVADTETRLTPRAFPDLASILAGVFYAGEARLAVPVPEVDEYAFEAEGSDDVGAFRALVLAPAEVAEVAAVGADGTSAALPANGVTEVARSGELRLFWDSADGGAQDQVEIELTAAGRTLSCLALDSGSIALPAPMLTELDADDHAQLDVRRVRVTEFEAPGLDIAYARIAATRSYRIRVR